MAFYFTLPFIFLKFWFIEAPFSIIKYFYRFNDSLMQLLSLPILLKSFFRPWKNEYRQGLVLFSIGMGMFIKTFVIIADLVILFFAICLEVLFMVIFFFFPIVAIAFLIK